ncbi:MAG: iron-sulfur cluster insertion protein ErpA [Alphaproteobacteria bacterium]|nr:iron-sulfur cluster insertion protein ErpA [Alphaproteobacteria bacterium]
MNAVIEASPVAVTDSAAMRIAQVLSAEPEGTMLRIAITGGGCSGFQYNFNFDKAQQDDDLRIESHGAVVLIDPTTLDLLRGSTVDFVEDLTGASFQIKNPNASSSCGCGNSFAV